MNAPRRSFARRVLIPGREGLDEIGVLRKRGVRMTLITNSLASTDEPLVYEAYRRYRPALLKLGVEMYELGSARSGASPRLGVFGSKVGRLHAKSAVIVSRVLFVGSMNFDPRSASENTELGLIVYEELARQQLGMLAMLKAQGAWRLRPGRQFDDVEWRAEDDDAVLHSDPDTTLWMRVVPGLLSPFMPESLL